MEELRTMKKKEIIEILKKKTRPYKDVSRKQLHINNGYNQALNEIIKFLEKKLADDEIDKECDCICHGESIMDENHFCDYCGHWSQNEKE